jgi:hypothetical protein
VVDTIVDHLARGLRFEGPARETPALSFWGSERRGGIGEQAVDRLRLPYLFRYFLWSAVEPVDEDANLPTVLPEANLDRRRRFAAGA